MPTIAIVWDRDAVDSEHAFEAGPAEAAAVQSVGGVLRDVGTVLRERGWEVLEVPLPGEPKALFRTFLELSADAVFNFAETWRGKARNEIGIGWALELSGIPYTGAPPWSLATCLDKTRARRILADAGASVPGGATITARGVEGSLEALRMPVIVKPAAQDASHGIDATSVCHTLEQARTRAAALMARGMGDALIEEYVEGREFNVSVVDRRPLDGSAGPRVLTIAEIDYSRFPPGLPRILTFDAKWAEESAEYTGSPSVAAKLTDDERQRIERIAITAWYAMRLEGYGRVDMRMDASGALYVIDVNPNPDLSRGAGLCLAAERSGLSYEDLVEGLAREAILRDRSR